MDNTNPAPPLTPPPFIPTVEETPPMPSANVAPIITSPPPKPRTKGGKVFAAVLGLLLLVGGVGAGVILIKNNQDIRNRAAESNTATATPIATPTPTPAPSATPIPKYFKESNTLKFNRAGTVIIHTTRKVELTLTPVGTTLENKKLVQTFDHTKTETFHVNAGDSYTIGAKFFNDSGKQGSALGWRKPYNPTTCGNEAYHHAVDIGALVSSIQASSSLNLDNPDVLAYPVQCWADAPNSRWNEDKHTGDNDAYSDTYDFNDARIVFSYDTGATTAPLCSSNDIERNENNTWVEIQSKDINLGDTVRFIAVVINPTANTKVQIRVSLNGSVIKDWTEATASSTSGEYYLEYPITQTGDYSVEQRIE